MPIKNAAELQQVREQIARLRRALEALRLQEVARKQMRKK